MDPLLRGAEQRYGAQRDDGSSAPAREEYAATRRWIASAREALRWAKEAAPSLQAAAMARACEALVLAEKHRAWARRWRQGNAEPTVGTCRLCARDGALGDGVCASCSEDPETRSLETKIAERARAVRAIGAYYAAAQHALRMARAYSREPGTSGRREREVVREVLRYRGAIRDLRDAWPRNAGGDTLEGAGPGLRKAPPPPAEPKSRTRTG